MPRADSYIAAQIGTGVSKTDVRNKILTNVEAAALGNALRADAADCYYSAWVSFLDAIHGVNKGFYTWAKVKLYYCVFYTFRASLAFDDLCAFHIGRAQFTVMSHAGASPVSCTDPGTHKAVMRAFQRQNTGHALLSQQIDLQDAPDWFIEKRESANYGQARFSEPECGAELDFALANGVRKTINAYLEEKTFNFVFDPDHAMIAYPLKALTLVGNQLLAGGGIEVHDSEQEFLKSGAKDRAGNLSVLLTEMRRLGIVP